MKPRAVMVLALVLLFSSAGALQATVIDFENVPGANSGTSNNAILDGYGGFSWTNFYVLHENFLPGSGYEYGVTSGEWAAYNAGDRTAFVSDDLFDFTGAYFTSAWDNPNTLFISGFNDSARVYRGRVRLNNSSPVWFQADWTDVDQLVFTTSRSHFVMDDFTIDRHAPVPEPATIILLGSGFVGLVAFRKKFTGKAV